MSSKCKPIQGLRASPSFNLETLIVNYGIRQLPIFLSVQLPAILELFNVKHFMEHALSRSAQTGVKSPMGR